MIEALIGSLVPSSLLILVIILLLTNPEKAERVGGWFLTLFSWTGKRIRRRSIKSTLQGQINTFARATDNDVAGSMPYNMRLDFISELDRAELDPTKETVIVRIRDRVDDDRNLVHAMLVFCTVGVIPQARRFLAPAFNEAIDVTVTRKLLNSLKHHSALHYLHEEVLPACAKKTAGLEEFCRIFGLLDEQGLFTRVVVSELRDFGSVIETSYPEEQHAREAEKFVTYVQSVATRPPGEEMLEIGHKGRYIASAFVFIGTGQAMLRGGTAPYLNHLRRLRGAGFQKAYLAARGDPAEHRRTLSIDMADRVAYLAERAGLAKRGRPKRYNATDQEGLNRPHILIEMAMIPP